MFPQKSQADIDREQREAEERAKIQSQKRHQAMWSWKTAQFTRLGFSEAASELLAEWKVDHHRVARMLSQGCERTLVLDIFRPDAIPASTEAAATPVHAAV